MKIRRLFPEANVPAQGERCERLVATRGVRIERILSAPGSVSGPYDQTQNEWVLLVQGKAILEVEGKRQELNAGEAIYLPAHARHAVLDTSADPPCVWVAVHID